MSRRTRPATATRRHTRTLAGWVLLGLLLCADRASASPSSLRTELERFARSSESAGLEFCAVFRPVDAPPPVERGRTGRTGEDREVRIGADQPLVPASVAKLTTTSFALERLGPDYTFRTRLRTDGMLDGDTLRGNLIVSGNGDPFLVSERLWLLARELRGLGIDRVTGSLRIDDSWLVPDSLDAVRGRDREFSERPYAAKLSSFAVNFNAAEVRIAPARETGAPARVDLGPLPCAYLRVDNRLTTVADSAAEEWILSLDADSLGEIARVRGTLRRSATPIVEYRSVRDPLRYSAAMLRSFLEAEGITIAGPNVLDATPTEAGTLLLDFPSLPLRELVDSANRYSNNFMADQIALALSTALPPDSATDSQAVTRAASLTRGGDWITERLRTEFGAGEAVRQLDGSGLNPADRLSGAVLAEVLARDWHDLRRGPEVLASLPMPGGDGTLRRRFGETPGEILRAKTGTMSNPPVSAMAGYLQTGDPSPTVFVLIMNGRNGTWDLSRMKSLQESWVREYLRP